MSQAGDLGIRGWELGIREKPPEPTRPYPSAKCENSPAPSSLSLAPSPQHPTPSSFPPEPSTRHPVPTWDTLGCELAAEVLRSSGKLHLRANGASMLPAVWPGDILTVSSHDAAEALPGDIVLFARDGKLVAHRIVEVRSLEFGVRSPEFGVRSQKAGFRIWDLGFRNRKNPQIANRKSPIANPEPRTPSLESRIPNPEPLTPVLFVTRGDSVEGNDAPVSSHELLGRVTAIERGSHRLTPHQSVASRLASWILRRSDLATRVVLKVGG